MVMGPLMTLVGINVYYAKEGVLVVKTYIESMSDENGFGAATEIG